MPIFSLPKKRRSRQKPKYLRPLFYQNDEGMGFNISDFGSSVIKTVSSTASSALDKFGDLTGMRSATDKFKSVKAASEFTKETANKAISENKEFTSNTWNMVDEIKSKTNQAKEATIDYTTAQAKLQIDPYTKLAKGDVKGAGGAYLKAIDPGQALLIDDKYLKELPLVQDVYKEVDVYTGGLVQRGVSAGTMPGKLVRGKPGLGLTDEKVSKAEFIQNMVFYAQMAAIVLSGGSAAAVIGFMSAQMKQGPLGETETGRTILTVGAVVGIAAAGGSGSISANIQTALVNEAKRRAAQEASVRVAEETGTGELGQVAVQSALGPGSFQESMTEYGKQEATKMAVSEVSAKTGTTGGLLTSMSIQALNASQGAKEGETGENAFYSSMKAQVMAKAQEEAIAIGKSEAEKRVGKGEMKLITDAAQIAASDDMSETIKNKAYNRAYNKAQREQNKLLNDQQKTLIKAAKTEDPNERAALTQKLALDEVKIYDSQRQRNSALKQAGLSPQADQDKLSANAKQANVAIAPNPNAEIPKEKREANAEKFKADSGEVLAKKNQKMVADAEETKKFGQYLKSLADQARALRLAAENEPDEVKKKQMLVEAHNLEVELVEKSEFLDEKQSNVINQYLLSKEYETQASVKAAAIEEGRYWYGYEHAHPMLKYGLVTKRS